MERDNRVGEASTTFWGRCFSFNVLWVWINGVEPYGTEKRERVRFERLRKTQIIEKCKNWGSVTDWGNQSTMKRFEHVELHRSGGRGRSEGSWADGLKGLNFQESERRARNSKSWKVFVIMIWMLQQWTVKLRWRRVAHTWRAWGLLSQGQNNERDCVVSDLWMNVYGCV